MSVIKLTVPDGEQCKGCIFLTTAQTDYYSYYRNSYCKIFECQIYNDRKCIPCMSCEKERKDND